MTTLTAAEHYDFRPDQDRVQRRDNAVYNLKQLNNLLKRAIINEALSFLPNNKTLFVADLCGGKGGDIKKWLYHCINSGQKLHYYLIDASRGEVERAQKRFQELTAQEKACFAEIHFICLDLFDYDAVAACEELRGKRFDVLSCQFALHYAYETEAKSIGFWKTVDLLSMDKSYLLLSHPCRQRVIEWSRAFPRCMHPNERLDNDVCGICFADPRIEHLFRSETLENSVKQAPQIGACYRFTLKDSLFQVPEYLMPRANFLHLQAQEYANYKCKFSALADSILSSNLLLSAEARQAVTEAQQISISSAEYEVACLYMYSIYIRDQLPKIVTTDNSKCAQEETKCEKTQPRRSTRVSKKTTK